MRSNSILINSFRILTEKRQYGDIVMPLQAIIEVLQHFSNYMNIPQIRELADKVKYYSSILLYGTFHFCASIIFLIV